jgi:hypothetical protein
MAHCNSFAGERDFAAFDAGRTQHRKFNTKSILIDTYNETQKPTPIFSGLARIVLKSHSEQFATN